VRLAFRLLTLALLPAVMPAFLTACRGSFVPVQSIALPSATSSRDFAGTDLLYVSNLGNDTVTVYSYPDGALQDTLEGFGEPLGLCSDAKGHVYVADYGAGQIVEFAHGVHKPIRVLREREGYASACAVNPTSGDLAVTIEQDTGSRSGEVLVYSHAQGKPAKRIDRSIFYYFFPAYDPNGDLFIDGEDFFNDRVTVAELPRGKQHFIDLSLDQGIEYPGGMQWDGDRLIVGDQILQAPRMYHFKISGFSGTRDRTTYFDGADDVFQFAIDGTLVIGGDYRTARENYWNFPGGKRRKTITRGVSFPEGVTISRAH